jgi:hypothetical protein
MFGTGQHLQYRHGIFSSLAASISALPDKEHMAVYRFYIIGSDGHLIRSVRCDCPNDSTAIKQAEHMLDGFSVELWHLERRIGRFDTIRARLAQRSP